MKNFSIQNSKGEKCIPCKAVVPKLGRNPNWGQFAWGRQAICLGLSDNLPGASLIYINWICAIFFFHLFSFEVFRAK